MKACIARLGLGIFILIGLVSCGYRLGGVQPVSMVGVKSLYIEVPKNNTQYTRLEAQLANHLSDALIADGRYKQARFEDADAKLVSTITSVDYSQIRPFRTNVLKAEELSMRLKVSWSIVSLKEASSVRLEGGSTTAQTRFFLEDNLQTSQQNGFPDALRRASRKIVSQISNTY